MSANNTEIKIPDGLARHGVVGVVEQAQDYVPEIFVGNCPCQNEA